MCGYTILIFVGLLVSLGSLVMRRRQTWLFAAPPRADGVALGIVLYCVFAAPPRADGVGGSASVAVPPRPDGVRAGIMGILMMLGPAFGRRLAASRRVHGGTAGVRPAARRSLALNALALSALVMAVQAPLVIRDVSFQLSLIVMATPLTAASFGDSS